MQLFLQWILVCDLLQITVPIFILCFFFVPTGRDASFRGCVPSFERKELRRFLLRVYLEAFQNTCVELHISLLISPRGEQDV
jgi:hypothetical protein